MASLRRAGLKFDIMTTSFFVGRRRLKEAKNSGMRCGRTSSSSLCSGNRRIRPLLLDPSDRGRRTRRTSSRLNRREALRRIRPARNALNCRRKTVHRAAGFARLRRCQSARANPYPPIKMLRSRKRAPKFFRARPILTERGRPKSRPMMAQYLEIKAANQGSLLFYRMGDFYELFFEDAEVAAKALGIVSHQARQTSGR